MDARQFEKYMYDLIKNTNFATDFATGGTNSKDNVYTKTLERISQQEELADDDLQMVAGGLDKQDKEKNCDSI